MIQVSVEIGSKLISVDEDVCKKIVKRVFKTQKIQNTEVTVIFGTDELLNSLKKEYFGKDHLTDVIAFRLNDHSEQNVEGEIYISVPRAKENAQKFNEPFEKEIARLMIHGTLHLIGYKDDTPKSKQKMSDRENQFLEIGIWNNLSTNGMKNEKK
jgi:rRNA maturation RNase YbeY